MMIEVFGPGCARCKQTLRIMEMALDAAGKRLGEDAMVQKVEDINSLVLRGVFRTPAVFVDGRKVCEGRIPTVEEARGWLTASA